MPIDDFELKRILPPVRAERRTLKSDMQKLKFYGKVAVSEHSLAFKMAAAALVTPVVLGVGARVVDAVNEPTHVEQLKVQIDNAKAHPEEVPKGMYTEYIVGPNQSPITIANELAPGTSQDHAEVYDEVLAQEDSNGKLQQGPILIETEHITSSH